MNTIVPIMWACGPKKSPLCIDIPLAHTEKEIYVSFSVHKYFNILQVLFIDLDLVHRLYWAKHVGPKGSLHGGMMYAFCTFMSTINSIFVGQLFAVGIHIPIAW